jgi:hypothetical protein
MKWNFECESERRDYLHDLIAARCNGFWAFNKQASVSVRSGADGFRRFDAHKRTISIAP